MRLLGTLIEKRGRPYLLETPFSRAPLKAQELVYRGVDGICNEGTISGIVRLEPPVEPYKK